MRVRGVLFDFGNTLFGHDPLAETIAGLGFGIGPVAAADLAARIDAAAAHPDEAVHRRDLDAAVWAARWQHLYAVGDEQWPGLGAAIDAAMHDAAQWVPYRDTATVLRGLRAAGVKVGVVSNTGWDVRGPFATHGLADAVDGFTLSYEVGAAKPHRAIFAIACARLGVEPAAVLMVGDDARADGGAGALGMPTLLLPPAPPGGDNGLALVLGLVGEGSAPGTAPSR
ncbi:MAG: HAD family hydrolase [Ilumatobacteraceae bacterium]